MINRGKHGSIYLYELTEQDFLIDDVAKQGYTPGNVLLFADKRQVEAGRELACADDLDAARAYLDGEAQSASAKNGEGSLAASALAVDTEAAMSELRHKICVRDDLLREVTDELQWERQTNSVLLEQLQSTREQLEVAGETHEELVSDLAQVSADTQSVMEEKEQLQQELAERITEWIELDLQNDDLRRQLEGADDVPRATTPSAESTAAAPTAAVPDTADQQTFTTSSGKQIHVYHDFPTSPSRTAAANLSLIGRGFARLVFIAVIAFVLLAAGSVLATAHLNGSSVGDALDVLLSSLNLE
jgi:regulator of replication initiation timing